MRPWFLMIVLGITGSIGMGKSTLGAMLEILGVPVHDADEAARVAFPLVEQAFPRSAYPGVYVCGTLNRKALARAVFTNATLYTRLNGIVHPYVRGDQARFIAHHARLGTRVVALDVPLLFETGDDIFVDYTLVVTASKFLQTMRVLRRPGMDADLFAAIAAHQMPDAHKRARADFVLYSGLGRPAMMAQLRETLNRISAG